MSLAALSDLPALADDLAKQAASGETVVVSGPTGSGRWSLGDELVRKLGTKSIDVRLPPFEAIDAALHGLLQAAAALGGDAVEQARDIRVALGDRAAEIADRAAAAGHVLVVRVPESWFKTNYPQAAIRLRREAAAAALFEGWLRPAKGVGRIVLLHERSLTLLPRHSAAGCELKAPAVAAEALEDEARWGSYAPAFRRVRQTPGSEHLSPIQLRLLVGVTALGERPEEIVPALWGGSGQLMPLLDRLMEQLHVEANEALLAAVGRLARTRFPLPRQVALDLARCPTEHTPLLTECIAYAHGGCLRVPDAVRTRLQRGTRRSDAETHGALATYHRTLDGVNAPPPDAGKMIHWLERAHHLGRTGDEGADEWRKLDLAGPEQLLDRAWSLSVEHGDFEGAAKLYRQRLDQDARDAYAWHYLGFNLQRAKSETAAIEHAYREAVRLEPDNAWWNSRLVTFLISDLRYRKAEEEWRDSIERVDSQETRVQAGPWLARHLHRWVVLEWLRHGEVERARAVFRRIPVKVLREDPTLLELRQRMEDAVEAVTLGESVYPTHVPMEERWHAPRVMPERNGKEELRRWMPGRVLLVHDKKVTFVVVLPGERRVFKQTVSLAKWKSWSITFPHAGAFFEMGFYGAKEKTVAVIEVRSQPARFPRELEDDEPEEEILAPLSAPPA